MILAEYSDLERYLGLSPNLDTAIRYLKQTTDPSCLADGREAIDKEDVYRVVSSYATRAYEESKYEVHRKYLDIQCLISGEERVYISHKSRLEAGTPYDEGSDKENLSATVDEVMVTLRPGMALILFPEDAHKACVQIGEKQPVRKLLLKVRI